MKMTRQSAILKLISTNDVETQDELISLLKSIGHDVKQATISRDIKDLCLIKVPTAHGRYKYSVARQRGKDVSTKFISLFSDNVLNIDLAKNIVIIKCGSGMAQAVCASLDAMEWDGIVGTIAGDDTIMVAARTDTDAERIAQEFRSIIQGR